MGTKTKQITVVSSEIQSAGKTVVTEHDESLNNRETEDNVILIATQQHRAYTNDWRNNALHIADALGPFIEPVFIGKGMDLTSKLLSRFVGVNSKMIFVMQGLRKVIMNKELRWTVLLCQEGYTIKQINKITSTFKNLKDEKGNDVVNDVILIEKDPKQIVDYLNDLKIKGQPVLKDKASSRSDFKVKRLYVYAHGIVGAFQLWMRLKSVEQEFGIPEAQKLKSEAFANNARIVSLACRTGIGNHKIDKTVFISEDYPKRRYDEMFSESLAQKLADSTKVQVNSLTRRTDYADTFNTSDELDFLEACDAYGSQTKPERPANKNKQGVYAHIFKNGLSSSEEKERYSFLNNRRKQRFIIDEFRFDPLGALHPVKPGTSPEGLSARFETFLPLQKV